MKKLLIIFFVFCILIVLGFVFCLYQYKAITPYKEVLNDSRLLDFCKTKYSYEDSNVSDYITQTYYPNGKNKEKLIELEPSLPGPKDLFNPDIEQKIMKDIEELVPDNFDKFISSFIQYNIRDDIKKKKSLKKDLDDYYRYGHCLPITCKTTQRAGTFWYLLSRYLDNNGDSENSLLLSHGIFYLARDFEREFDFGLMAITKTHTYEITHVACKSSLIWASKPKPDAVTLSKDLANDILELINSEFPCSENIKYEQKEFEKRFEDDIFKNAYSKYYNLFCELRKTETYKNLLNTVYQKPLDFIDKPLNEIGKELEDYKKTIEALYKKESDFQENINLLKDPDRVVILTLLKNNQSDYEKMKKSHEQKLAEMELTAIALAINSYASENNQLPESMAELNKWFGKELPINRLTQKPYELDLKGKHLLYNNGVDGIQDLDSKNTDDIYFDFSFN